MSTSSFVRISFLAFILVSTLSAKCATTPAGPAGGASDAAASPPSAGTVFGRCTSDAVKDAANHILPDVANAFVTEDYEAAIASLLGRFTLAEVKCAVELFINATHRKAMADKNVAEEVRRARAYLDAHP